MVKARVFYIFEGHDTSTPLRGTEPETYATHHGPCCRFMFKEAGVFGKWHTLEGIPQQYFGETKSIGEFRGSKWRIKDKSKLIKVMCGLPDLEPYTPDLNVNLISLLKSKTNEAEMYKRRAIEAERNNISSHQDDLYWQKVDKEFERVGKARNKVFTDSGMGWGGFGLGRPLYNPPPPES